MADELILIDGMALAYRGHFALMRNPRISSKGVNTSAPFVFINVVLKLLEERDPSHIAVVFDTKEPTFRHKAYDAYKATRDAMPEDLSQALPYLDTLCAALNIPVLRLPGYEADDVIGTIARVADERSLPCLMVTPDKDYAQLVSANSRIYKPGRRGDDAEILGVAEICEAWGIERIDQVIDILGMMGDSSDNIPGVPGIGQKTAQKLIADYGSMEGVYEHIDEIKGKRKENLVNNREQADMSKWLVTIDRKVPLEIDLDALVRRDFDRGLVTDLFNDLEFRGLGQKLLGADFELGGGEAAVERTNASKVFHDYHCVQSDAEIDQLVAALAGQESFCFDTETVGTDPHSAELVGMSYCWEAHQAWYVPVPADQAAARSLVARFAAVFADERIEKVAHNAKFDICMLQRYGAPLRGPVFDTMLAAFLVMPDAKRSMDALAAELLNYQPIPITELIGEKKAEQRTMREVPIEQVVEYAAEDADITFQLAEEFRPLLAEHGAERVFHEVECPLVPVLVRMELEGITVDVEGLAALSHELELGIATLSERITELAGEEFNLNSPKQLGVILFDKLELDLKAKKTKTGQYKTNEQVLQRLASRHELPQAILDYRALTKLKSTYVDALPAYVAEDGRVHTHYEQAVAATGRLASNDPNLQNIPIRRDRGREVRKAFVSRGAGWQLLSADYSQVELRIAAEMSGDANMRAAFRSGTDFHTATAVLVNGLDSAEQVDAEQRRRAKTINFGILYGISAFGLSDRLQIPRGDAKQLIEAYYASFPQLRIWLDAVVAGAKEQGFVETLTGRRRYLRDIGSSNGMVRAGAERVAMNAPIQGTAADLIKLAMIGIDAAITERGLRSRMLLQVHDELVFDCPDDEIDTMRDLVETGMREALHMETPLAVESGVGTNWLVAH
ncbi:MAG: DNA polymerase I [Planctomycetota bacterium]|jgi:DNA polymerase-1|nr:DNA polymerase I [Planctomycetota bacterium]